MGHWKCGFLLILVGDVLNCLIGLINSENLENIDEVVI